MLFNSLQFFIFFPLVAITYFALPYRLRCGFLLLASYYFYMCWKPEYIILIIISTLVDYYAGLQMGKTKDQTKRKKFLLLSIFSNLGILFGFKYFNFFNNSFHTLFDQFNIFYNVPAFDVLLPVGISFYTFQTLSYSIDVYRGKKEPEKNFLIFALYVAFFPQLVAGPIERSTRLLPQFYKKHNIDYERITDGLKLILWGLFKKVVIADRLAALVDIVYNNPYNYTGFPLIIATVFFAFQIYCDFSGYSDIAIGTAQVFGINLMDNFNRPYFSKSISEFWKRWHISLSTWFKDYVYISMGGNRVKKSRWYWNLMVTFVISGLWHGANWTFVFWGALNGFYLLMSLWTQKIRERMVQFFQLDQHPRLHKYIRIGITFTLTCFAWIFFRANNLTEAFYIVKNIFTGSYWTVAHLLRGEFAQVETLVLGKSLDLSLSEFVIAIICICILEGFHLIQRHSKIRHMLREKPLAVRWAIYYTLIFMIISFGVFNKKEFIYFQF